MKLSDTPLLNKELSFPAELDQLDEGKMGAISPDKVVDMLTEEIFFEFLHKETSG